MDRVVKVYTDGASRGNPGPSSIGILIINEEGKEIKRISEYIGTTTNNIAEYRALLRAIMECRKLKFGSVQFFTDSQLLANQINGIYRVTNEDLKPLYVKLKGELLSFKGWSVVYIPRGKNSIADLLANQALDRREGK
ncbi:MAG: ribonuclease HI family protein [candidate division WOR-3 bacterium]|nr:ribonuclease HI family protein [candidate division WOR-3 bacterium]